MGIIIKLDPHLANMIAAGEVVERVGNVVKELLENAVDAGASVIAIELKESGLAFIRVADNGSGMEPDDAVAAFERHATSKIRSERDLFRIASLGFRGEALPSIAAVSRVELVTSTGGAEGRKVVYRDGVLLENGLAAAAKGTSVTVTKLFYNTPARLKFLKSPHAELAFIAELVDKYAIARPDIAFSLANDGRSIVRTSGNNDRSAVVAAVYGVAAAKEMVPFSGTNRDYRVKGRLASPIVNRVSRSYVTVAVNGRIVRNPKAVQAIVEGYGQTIPKGRYPIVFVDIATDPLLIDVNIHPTKLEIKFSEEASLLGLLTTTIRKAVAGFRIIQPAERPESSPAPTQTAIVFAETAEAAAVPDVSVFEHATPYPAAEQSAKPFPEFEYVGQYAGTYLIFQNAEGLFLVDQHAAAERIRYEDYARRMGAVEPSPTPTLVPFEAAFSVHDAVRIEPFLPELERFGVTMRPTGAGTFAIAAVPSWFPKDMEGMYVEQVVETLLQEKTLSAAGIRDELAKSLACKRSIKANRYINRNEVEALMRELNRCHDPYTCPHGRPIVVKIALLDIEKWFRRVL